MPRQPPDLFEGQRTRPWRPEEFAGLEGIEFPLAYEIAVSSAELVLRLPGGGQFSATEAHRAGLRLRMPRVLRKEIAVDGEEWLG
jgi:hypothetical protein